MSNNTFSGRVGWIDLTISDTGQVRDFYANLLGLRPEPVDMGGYSDFNLVSPETDEPVVGVCHPAGANAELPPLWMVYFIVPDLAASISFVEENGGEVISGPRGGFCVIRDPGGAVCALFQVPSDPA